MRPLADIDPGPPFGHCGGQRAVVSGHRIKTVGIVRGDVSVDTSSDVGLVRAFGDHPRVELVVVRVERGGNLSLLLSTLPDSGISAVVVPTVLHLNGWLNSVRRDVDVWTLTPLGCWPRFTRTDAATPPFVPGVLP